MRVIAGRLGGRLFDSPSNSRTHPMSDKARGALFNILGDLQDLSVLDAFAGTGALSFEAISRGAVRATTIEMDKTAQRVITNNIRTLGVAGKVKLIQATANAWLQTTAETFDIVLCDPPYHDLQPNLLQRLTERVVPDGIFVLSWPNNEAPLPLKDLTQIDQRSYGDMQLIFYRRTT